MIPLKKKKQIICETKIFKQLPEGLLEDIAKKMGTKHFPAGSFLFHEGEPGDQLFIIYHGQVEIHLSDSQKVIATLGKGEVLGEMGAIANEARSASAFAKENVSLLFLKADSLRQLIYQSPELAFGLMDILIKRLKDHTTANTSVEPVDKKLIDTKKQKKGELKCANCFEYNSKKTLRCDYCGEYLEIKWIKRIIMFLSLAVAMTAILLYQNLSEPEVTEEKIATKVPFVYIQTIEPQNIDFKVTGYGRIRATRTLRLTSQVSGRITKVHPNLYKGSFIKQGEELIKIDDKDYKLAINKADVQYRITKGQLIRLQKELKSISEQIKVVKENTRIAEQNAKNSRKLYLRKGSSKTQYDQAQQAYLNLLQSYLQLKAQLDSLPQQIIAAKASLEEAKLNKQNAINQQQKTRIICPFPIRVKENYVVEGTVIDEETVLAVLEDTTTAEVVAIINKNRTTKIFDKAIAMASITKNQLNIDAQITSTIDGNTYTWPGKVVRLEPINTKDYTIPVVIKVENPWLKNPLKPPLQTGEFVTVNITGRKINNVLLLPHDALRENNTVHIVQNNQLQIRQVEIQERYGDFFIIKKGLQPKDQIILSVIPHPVPKMRLKTKEIEIANSH